MGHGTVTLLRHRPCTTLTHDTVERASTARAKTPLPLTPHPAASNPPSADEPTWTRLALSQEQLARPKIRPIHGSPQSTTTLTCANAASPALPPPLYRPRSPGCPLKAHYTRAGNPFFLPTNHPSASAPPLTRPTTPHRRHLPTPAPRILPQTSSASSSSGNHVSALNLREVIVAP